MNDGVQAYFLESTPADKIEMRVVVGINVAIIVFCLTYLISEFNASAVGWLEIGLFSVLGYFVADFTSGLVHWGLDTWFDEESFGRVVSIAREHHTHPQNILKYGFLEHAALGSVGSIILIGPLVLMTASFKAKMAFLLMIIWTISATCLLFGTSFHNLGHKRSHNFLLLFLQRSGLVISPKHHWVHHGNQTVRYCAINGWANYICDALGVWRGFEFFVGRVTGATPRANDLEWQRIFKESGTLTPPSTLLIKE